jgi:GNAT superfamily N-acetyltransferase
VHEPFTIQPARPGDHADFVRFHAELGLDNPVADAERWTGDMMPHTFFLEESGRKVAYAFVEVFGELAYVRHVVVDPLVRGRGVGRALMDAIARRSKESHCARWELNVKSDNVPAIRLYQSVGMSTLHLTTVVRIDWKDALRLPAVADVFARDVDADEEHDIERAMSLPDGKILRLREQPDQVFVQLVAATGGVLGFARFDPAFPGAFPFRLRGAQYAGEMLRALHEHRAPAPDWLQLVIEDDLATSALLRDHGARHVFDLVHMAGDIP